MIENSYLPIFETTRGNIVESRHYGAIAIANRRGELLAWWGDPHVTTYLRSSAKPFQAMPFLESGGQEAYNLTPREVALICASHSGTDDHVQTARSIQAKAGVLESDLLCGVHPLSHKPTVEAMNARGEGLTNNRHNCSGKHTGMVAFARLLNLPYSLADHAYIDLEHPIQKRILRTFSEMCNMPEEQVQVGIDGCSAPNFAAPLVHAATAYARLCDPVGLPEERAAVCRSIFHAMTSHPDMVGGPDSFDTDLMRVAEGKIVCKGGAEGFQALGILPDALSPGSPGMGIVFKVSDGDLGRRAQGAQEHYGAVRPAVTLEILRQLGALNASQMQSLATYGPTYTLTNFRKIQVGEACTCFTLKYSGQAT